MPWQSGQAMSWDLTVATTLAESYLPASSATAAAAAEAAASRKMSNTLISQPHSHFSRLLSRHWDRSILLTSSVSWDVGSCPSSRRSDRPHRLSVTVQRYNAVA